MSIFSLPSSYDSWKTSTPCDDEKVAHLCEHCDGEIYVGEECIYTDEGHVHEDCYDEFAWNKLGASREEAKRYENE